MRPRRSEPLRPSCTKGSPSGNRSIASSTDITADVPAALADRSTAPDALIVTLRRWASGSCAGPVKMTPPMPVSFGSAGCTGTSEVVNAEQMSRPSRRRSGSRAGVRGIPVASVSTMAKNSPPNATSTRSCLLPTFTTSDAACTKAGTLVIVTTSTRRASPCAISLAFARTRPAGVSRTMRASVVSNSREKINPRSIAMVAAAMTPCPLIEG